MFNEYQQDATSVFKPIKPLNDLHIQVLDWCLGLGGEAGEVLDLMKHAIYHEDSELDKMELAKELGDVLWYVSAIATTFGIDLSDVALLNQVKLKHRYAGSFSAEASADRKAKEADLKATNAYKCLKARILNTQCAPLTVIVVGPDGSGKTTLTTKLAERAGMKRIKCDYRQENKPQLARQYLMSETDVIFDRFYYPDEYIYSTVKGIPMENEYINDLFKVLDLLQIVNPVIMYVDADMDTLVKRSEQWADDYVTVEHLVKIRELYEDWLKQMESLGIPVLKLDTSTVPLDTEEYNGMLDWIIIQFNQLRRSYGTSLITGRDK